MADIHDPLFYPTGDTVKKHALESPIGEKDQVFVRRRSVRQHIAINAAQEIGFHTAKLTGKQVVRLLQGRRCPALRALVLDEEVRAFHRTYCNTWLPACFRYRTSGRTWIPVFLQQDGHTANRTEHLESGSCRILRIV